MSNSNIFLGIASSILISVGSITTINTLSNPMIGIAIIIAGSIGLGIREFLKPKPTDIPSTKVE